MTTLRIGIASQEEIRKRTLDIASGRLKPGDNEPKVWFTSVESLAQVLSEHNRALIAIIKEHHPESVSALAELVGREQGNLSRTLKKMENYGIVELKRIGKQTVPIVIYDTFELYLAA